MTEQKTVLSFFDMKKGLLNAADDLISREIELSELDSYVGDGDHGVTIKKAFQQLKEDVEKNSPADFNGLFMTAAMAMMNTAGGAIGPILSSMFLGFAKSTNGKIELQIEDVAEMFEAGMQSIQDMGGAKPGDRTMLDALYPAVETFKNIDTNDILEAFIQASLAAEQGAKETANMVAKHGRAKNLGERSLGYVDAGATSMMYFLKAITESLRDS